jgi:hypothetical protein
MLFKRVAPVVGEEPKKTLKKSWHQLWLGRQDSNLRSRDQNPLPYRLATPQNQIYLNKITENNKEGFYNINIPVNKNS